MRTAGRHLKNIARFALVILDRGSLDLSEREFDYVVVGAGPGGLQLARFLQMQGRNYVVLERAEAPGSFFSVYPRHRTLISINKVHTGFVDPETNLRWDWNSLLGDDPKLTFTHYTNDYFPHADSFLRYLSDFAERHTLRIEYSTEVAKIGRRNGRFRLDTSAGPIWAKRVIVATGRAVPYRPPVPGIEYAEDYSTVSIDPRDFVGQRVLIIGKGNSGFETADNLVGTAAVIHMLSPTPVRMAWRTHYVGDLRAVNNNLLDTYQLKSQNTILDAELEWIRKEPNGQLRVRFWYTHADGQTWELTVDRVITCAGFRFDASLFDPKSCAVELTPCGRFPLMTPAWESTSIPDLYYAGALMHQRDYRKSFSGFIHGFRYNIEFLARYLAHRYEGAQLSGKPNDHTASGLGKYIIDRVNSCSSLFQQPGFLADVIRLQRDGALCYADVPVEFIPTHFSFRCHLTLTMEYGKIRDHEDPFNIRRAPMDGSESRFIHPVIRAFQNGKQVNEYHVPEDLENRWGAPMYVEPLVNWLETAFEAAPTALPVAVD